MTPHVLTAEGVRVDARPVPLLEPTTLAVRSGERLLVAGDPGHGHTALALALGGRLAVDAGTVALDGVPDRGLLRRHVALVDVPGVTEPDAVLPLRTVAADELALAGLPARRRDALAALRGAQAVDLAGSPLEAVPPATRTRVLATVAARRRGVAALVLVAPDRFGGDPRSWWHLAGQLAAEGLAVVVTCADSTAFELVAATRHWPGPAPVALGAAAPVPSEEPTP